MSGKIEVTREFLEFIVESCKELRIHGCTLSDINMLDKLSRSAKYYLRKGGR